MLASSDPTTYVALIFLLVVMTLAVKLQTARRQRSRAVHALAAAVGHPSMMGRRGPGRRDLASVAAHELAQLGMMTEVRGDLPVVRAWGLAGCYILAVTRPDRIIVDYQGETDAIALGDFHTLSAAVREIAAHADLRTLA